MKKTRQRANGIESRTGALLCYFLMPGKVLQSNRVMHRPLILMVSNGKGVRGELLVMLKDMVGLKYRVWEIQGTDMNTDS